MSKKIIFLGCYIGNNFEYLLKNYYFKNSSVSNSEYEKTLLKGFLKNNIECIFISAPVVGKWPKQCRKPYLKLHSEEGNIRFCNYSTIKGLSNFSKTISLLKTFKKVIKKENKNDLIVVGCEAHLPYLKVLKYAKKMKLKTSLIVPDLPENMSSSKNILYKYLKRKNVSTIYKFANLYVDSFLFFTEPMKEKFNLTSKKYLIREGIIDEDKKKPACHDKTNKISYIGKTNRNNGLDIILYAAKAMPQFEFHVYGNGDMDNYLQENKTENLFLHGFFDPNSIESALQNSFLMLSPRRPDNSRTKYSFPSKIFSYITSEKPIVTFKLPCYSSDFDDVLIYPKDITAESFVEAIKLATNSNHVIDYNKIMKKYRSEEIAKKYLEILYF